MENFTRRYRKVQKQILYEALVEVWEEECRDQKTEFNFWQFFKAPIPPKEEEFPAFRTTPDLLPCPDPIWNQG